MSIVKKYLTDKNIPFTEIENRNEIEIQTEIKGIRCIIRNSKIVNYETYTKIGSYEAKNQSQAYIIKLLERVRNGERLSLNY
ncbi:hypothetical protein [Jeotgalibaca porci]|uniref:hypothetical protein n=1 Tax=Jeotgalibaca porci TaxID=1868793 RepID=UPI00359F19EC